MENRNSCDFWTWLPKRSCTQRVPVSGSVGSQSAVANVPPTLVLVVTLLGFINNHVVINARVWKKFPIAESDPPRIPTAETSIPILAGSALRPGRGFSRSAKDDDNSTSTCSICKDILASGRGLWLLNKTGIAARKFT